MEAAGVLTMEERFAAETRWSRVAPSLLAAVALGACVVERHITLDRSMFGSDQAASVEPQGFTRMVRDIRTVSEALGDGLKRVYPTEVPIRKKLRRVG